MSEVAAGLPPPLNASEVHHCVLVKGLPWQASANAVASLFPAASGTPLLAYDASGEACVPFASAADARDALRVDGTVVNGWTLTVEACDASEYAKLQDEVAPPDGEVLSVLRLGSLPPHTTRRDVAAAFDGFDLAGAPAPDEPSPVVVGVGRTLALANAVYLTPVFDTGRFSGEGYVVFSSPAEAARALAAAPGLTVGGAPPTAALAARGEVYSMAAVAENKGLGAEFDAAAVVRVRGIAHETPRRDIVAGLRDLLAGGGAAPAAVHVARKADGRHAGEALLDFGSESAAAAGRAVLAGKALDGRELDARVGLRCELYAALGGTHVARIHDDRGVASALHVRGIPFAASGSALAAAFADTGATPRDVFVVQRWDGKPGGEAFIAYATPEAAAAAAAAKDGRDYGGRRLDCAVTVRAELYDALTRPPALASEMAPGGSGRPRSVGGWAEGFAVAREELDVVLRGKGTPFETSEADARRFFAGFNVVAVACVGGTAADGRARTTDVFVEFASLEDAQAALCKQKDAFAATDGPTRWIELYPANRRETADAVAGRAVRLVGGALGAVMPAAGAGGGGGGGGGGMGMGFGAHGGGGAGGGGGGACFGCGQPGHRKADCPQAGGGGGGGGGNCFSCQRPGHIARDCPDRAGGPRAGGADRACYSCGSTDHISRDCPTGGGGGGGRGGGGGAGACYNCGQTGHRKIDCPAARAPPGGGGGAGAGGAWGGGYAAGPPPPGAWGGPPPGAWGGPPPGAWGGPPAGYGPPPGAWGGAPPPGAWGGPPPGYGAWGGGAPPGAYGGPPQPPPGAHGGGRARSRSRERGGGHGGR